MQVANILQTKGSNVHTIRPTATAKDAVTALYENGIGALVVSEDDVSVNGIISERDIVHAMANKGSEILLAEVSNFMSTDVMTCRMKDTARNVLTRMTARRVRHMPVVENGELCGMVSIGDAVKSRLDEVTHEADALREYISQS